MRQTKEAPSHPVGTPKRVVIVVTACICLTLIPLLIFLGYSLYQSYDLQSTQRVEQRIFAARLAGATVAAELDSIREFGSWYSQSPKVRRMVREQQWRALSMDMDRVVAHLPAVVRLFASDREGRLWADSPRKPAVHGLDFSFRDWFKGVVKQQDTYLSHAYRRTAAPRIQVASMAFPVKNPSSEITGIVVFQLSLDAVFTWAASTPLKSGGKLVFIDHHEQSFLTDEDTGKVVLNKAPINYAALVTEKLETGDSEVFVRDDGQTIAVYARVPGWSWGIHIEESAESFFAGRDRQLHTMMLAVGLILALGTISIFTAFVLLRALADKERALARANTHLVSANRNLHDFGHAVSHDLRAPLRAMSGYAEALVEDHGNSLDEQGRHYLERIKASSRKLGGMIEDMLAVARIPQSELKLQDVDLSHLARDIADELQAGEPNRDVDIRIQPGLKVRGDSTLLTLILRNLLHNAWKFTRSVEQPQIELGCEQTTGEQVYFVRDNGAGFDSAYAGKLFTMFERLHSESEFEGTGIGLAATLQAVERHDGRIWADSREGEGAVFRFTIRPS